MEQKIIFKIETLGVDELTEKLNKLKIIVEDLNLLAVKVKFNKVEAKDLITIKPLNESKGS